MGSIRERAEYAQQQKEKWKKIFIDLRKYLDGNLPIVIYDFSAVSDRITTLGSRTAVHLTISPGVKVIPNRTALLVHKTVMDNWEQVKKMEENKSWVNSVREANNFRLQRYDANYVKIGIFDEYGDNIDTVSMRYYGIRGVPQVIAQHKYYDENKFSEVKTSGIPIEKITGAITPKIIEVGVQSSDNSSFSMKLNPPIMTVPEWQEWLSLQGAAR
jgi:hypothetical protein